MKVTDGETDGQTPHDGRPRLHIASCGNNEVADTVAYVQEVGFT